MSKKKVAILISGRGSNMEALIKACQDATFPASIELVISNKKEAYGLKIAQSYGIHTQSLNRKNFRNDHDFDSKISAILKKNNIEIICTAGYMKILTKDFVEYWHNQIINIHPSLLPDYKGLNTHKRVLNELSEAYQNVYTEAVGHYDTHVRLQRGGKWNAHTVNVRKTEKELIQKFLDQGFRIEKPPAEDYERFENPYDDYVDDDAREQARRDDELMGDIEVDPNDKPEGLEDMKKRMAALDREIKMAHAQGREDNEHPEDSMYIKDPEELKKALIWHHGNYARLRNKCMRG